MKVKENHKMPFYKKWWFVVICTVVAIGAISNLYGCASSQAENPNTPPPLSSSPDIKEVEAPQIDVTPTTPPNPLALQYSFYEESVSEIQEEMDLDIEEADEVFLVLVQCGLDKTIKYIFENADSKTKETYYTVGNVGSEYANVFLDDNTVNRVMQNGEQIYPVIDSPEPEASPTPSDITIEPSPTPSEPPATEPPVSPTPDPSESVPQEEETPSPSVAPPDNTSGNNKGGSNNDNDSHKPERDDSDKYVLNTSTKKFHYSSCSEVDKIKSKNYSTIDNRDSAISRGYVPCKRCDP